MIGKHTVYSAFTVATLVAILTALPASASAEERYSDDDSGYLRVASRVVQPVSIVLENVVFKPFTAFLAWSDPRIERAESLRYPRECTSVRPHRACSRAK